MTAGIVRRREQAPEPRARQLDPKPDAEELIDQLARLEALKDAGVLSASQYARQRARIFHGLV